ASAGSAPDKGAMEKAGDVSGRIGTATINALGYEEERRHLAKKIQADPYTTNPILSEKWTDVAWVMFSAREAVNLTTAVLMPYSMVMSTVSLTNNLVWDMKPADIIALNQKKATELSASEDQVQALTTNKNYSITYLTNCVGALERLGPIAGRAEVIALAGPVANEDQARFLMSSAQMLAHHHEWVTKLTSVAARGTVVGKTATGGLVVAAPVDYIAWTENVATFARRPDFAASSLDIYLTGRMSPRARQEFERIGWDRHGGSHAAAGNGGKSGRGGPGEADLLGHPHQLGHRARAHLLHHAAAVDLDRLLRGAELRRDLLVQHPAHDERHHLALARRQRRDVLLDDRALGGLPARGAILDDRALGRVQQIVIVERLREEVDGAALHGARRDRHVAVAADEDDRDRARTLQERRL